MLEDTIEFLTLPQVAKELGLDRDTVVHWIEVGLLPVPTKVKPDGLRLFSERWLKQAKTVVESRRK